MGFNFTKEISLKLNRTKKKVYQKIEVTFNFKEEINVKIIRNKKKINPEIWSQTYTLGSSNWKSHRSSVILKIVRATPQLVQNLTPIRKLFGTILHQKNLKITFNFA